MFTTHRTSTVRRNKGTAFSIMQAIRGLAAIVALVMAGKFGLAVLHRDWARVGHLYAMSVVVHSVAVISIVIIALIMAVIYVVTSRRNV